MKRIGDRLLLAAVTGFPAALAADLSLYLINLGLPGQNVNMPEVTLQIFLNPASTKSFWVQTMGVIWSTIVGGTYALIYLVTLDLTGWKNLWLKAILIVNGTWLLGAGWWMNLFNLTVYTRNEPISTAAFYLAHMLFATYLYLLVSAFGEQRTSNRARKDILSRYRKASGHRLLVRPLAGEPGEAADKSFVEAIKPRKIK